MPWEEERFSHGYSGEEAVDEYREMVKKALE